MLKILQNEKVINGLTVVGFGLLAIGIALNFQNKKTEKTEIKVESSVKGETVAEPTETKVENKSAYVKTMTGKVNINTAGITELDALPGVGPAIAQRIIDYRKEKNGFINIAEIKLVKGIGDKMYEKIKDKIEI